eukprot:gene28530-34440_t
MLSRLSRRGLITAARGLKDPKIPQFIVGIDNGYLPREDPIVKLPAQFGELEDLLSNMPKKLANGKPGYLAQEGKIYEASPKVPLYDVSKIEDTATLTALFRDLTFWASAYLLEPCDYSFQRTGSYGLGKPVLPKNIAVPLAEVSKKIGAAPFMEYAQSYALYNWKRKNPSKPIEYENLELIRSFEGSEHEAGFILVHVGMVAHSGRQVKAVQDVLEAASAKNRVALDKGMDDLLQVMNDINGVMETMWKRSRSDSYNTFRAYIMGTKSQPMFPKGVIYEGVSNEPTFFRGESGANDTIIPTLDNLLQLTERMPNNPLTEILMDFRKYRPVTHNDWLTHVHNRARESNLFAFATADSASAVRYLSLLDQVRDFRDRHWRFTKEYILKYSNHPVATGGSPIVTWLPNQLGAVLNNMVKVSEQHVDRSKLSGELLQRYDVLRERGNAQER